ncbi:hypothetical protein [Bosea sp. TAB14]|uniref:hypothetical protein n=1 Tax=Bosea sp. TAB14 TaxID=3237481 RepID=UPI003F92ED72
MKLYRTIWNVQDSIGAFVKPGGEATLDAETATALAGLGAIHREPIGDAPAAVSEAFTASAATVPVVPAAVAFPNGEAAPSPGEQRLAAILALVPQLQVGDFTQAGQLRAEARRRISAELGFEPTDDEIRAAGEVYAKAQAEQTA